MALAAYELRLVLRRGEGLLITFVIPAGVLLVFSAFDPGAGSGVAPVDRLLPGSIALAVIATSLVSLAITTGYERAYGVIKRLGGSPAGSSVVVAAKTASVLLVEAVQVALLLGIAVGLLGFRAGPTASAPVVVAALLLGTIAFAGLGLLMAGTLRAEATLALATVASVLPPAALSELLAIGLGTTIADTTQPMAILAGWAILLAVLAVRRFRWD